MQKIGIITDSTCDLTVDELKSYDIDFVPVYIIIEGKKYKQNIDITNDELYHQLIDEKKHISTAAPSPGEFVQVFEKVFEKVEYIIFLSVSSQVSSLYQIAKMVAKNHFHDKNITIIDTKSVSLAHALLVQEAAKMVKENTPKEKIITYLEYLSNFAKALPLLDTLEYIYRGGRLKLYQKLIGNLLGVKALIRIDKDGSKVDGKIKGRANALIHFKMCGLQIQDGLLVNRMYVAYTTNKSIADDVANFLKEKGNKNIEVLIKQLGPAVGTHGGNDLVGYAFIGHYHPKMFTSIGEIKKSIMKQKEIIPMKG